MVWKGLNGPKRVRNGQKHRGLSFWTPLDYLGWQACYVWPFLFVFLVRFFGISCRWLLPAGAEEPSSLTTWPALKWTCPRPVSIFLRNVLGVFCVEKVCYETNYESHGTIRTNLSIQSTWTTSHDMQFPTVAAKLHFLVSLSASIET